MQVEISYRENGHPKIVEINYTVKDSVFEVWVNGKDWTSEYIKNCKRNFLEIQAYDLLQNIERVAEYFLKKRSENPDVKSQTVKYDYSTLKDRIRLFLRSDLVNTKCYRHFETPVFDYNTFKNIRGGQSMTDTNAIYINDELHRIYGSFYFAPNELFEN